MTADASDPFAEPRDLNDEDAFFAQAEEDPGIAAAEARAAEEPADPLTAETGELPADPRAGGPGGPPADADLLETFEEYAEGEEGEEGEAEEAAGPREPSPYDRPGGGFVVHPYAGYENKVKSNLASRVRSMNMEERIFEVVIPMEDVIEFKAGRKTVVPKKVFPGYLLVRMYLDDDSWRVVRDTPGVPGFVGGGAKPTPLSRKEVEAILGVEKTDGGMAGEGKKARPRLEFDVGEQVRVVTGPFA